MSLLAGAWAGLERRALSVVPQDLWRSVLGFMSATGITVTPKTALQSAVVFACVRVLAESEASLPLHVFRRRDDGRGKDKARDYFLYPLLHTAPNEEMTSFEFRETLMGHLTLWGNAYAEIEYSNAGVARALWPLRPDRMELRRVRGQLAYVYHLPESGPELLQGGRTKVFDPTRIMHLRGLGFNGLQGYSVIRYHREAIGLDLATREFGARFFGNDARPGGVLEHPGVLSDKAHKRVTNSWESRHQGLDKSHRTAILEEGMSYKEIGMPLEDAQFLETRKYERTEIAGLFRVPPHMVADLERATFSNIEHQDLAFVKHSLRPWLVRWEQRMDVDLIPPADRERYFTRHSVEGLLRGDSAARAQYFRERFNVGSLTPNQIRELEDENPIEGGDQAFVQLNMIPIAAASQGLALSGESSEGRSAEEAGSQMGERDWRDLSAAVRELRARRSAQTRYRLQQAQMRVYADVAGRVLRREANDVGNAARRLLQRDLPDFENWLREFYEEHAGFVATNMWPVARAYAEMVAPEVAAEVGVELTPALEERVARFVSGYVRTQGDRHAARHEARLRDLLVEDPDEALAGIEAQLEAWREEDAAREIALEESVRAGGAVATMLYTAAGVAFLRWRSIGDSCPYCTALNGRTVGVTEYFLAEGEELQPDGAEKPLRVTSNRRHPPAHRGCLPADSLVLTRGRIAASSERWFDGDLVVLHTASGNKLSCTPNHPILTNAGWIAAGLLDVGDYVISDRSIDFKTIRAGRSVFGESENVPAFIHHVAETVGGARKVVAVPVPVSAEDFHGDGVHSEVAIIRANGLLLDECGATLVEHNGESLFQIGDANPAPLTGSGSGAVGFETIRDAIRSSMRRCNLRGSLFGRPRFPDELLGIALPSDFYASVQQAMADRTPGDTKLFRKRELGLAVKVLPDKGSNIDVDPPLLTRQLTNLTWLSQFNAGLKQASADGVAGHAQFFGEGSLRLAGDIFSDEIVHIERYPFSGHVYNLQTEDGYYVAEGIVTHNCDCLVTAG